MSDAEAKNDKGPSEEEDHRTASFDGLPAGPGEQIGPFRIEKELGRGGAGVVYLAHDTRLDRPVAIKSVPAEMMDDPKVRSRFSREARLLASLNHPNIAAIYEELQEAEGVGYLVLEYVPGQTLAERIAKGGLELEEALSIGLQIAQAVAAAHEHDVIHRDIKPGNIKITPEGKVKVLDFGLAKAVGGEVADLQSTVTEPGRVIGTPAYMSPEQTRGKPADTRSDIWSFGCVLYEMLSGKVPFKGETFSDTLANILDRDPDWQALPRTAPANIVVLLRRCLEKKPQRRLQHIGDAAIEISETLSLPATAPPVTTSSVTVSRPEGPWRLKAAVACLAIVAVAAILVTRNLKRPASRSRPATRFIIRPETTLEVEALWHHALALSPDGKHLAYVEEGSDGRRKIYLRRLDEFTAKPLPGTEGAISPFFSPDGEWVGYVDHFQRKLKKVSVKGGEPIVLGESVGFGGGSWAAGNIIVFVPDHGEGLWRISASGEGLEQLTVPDPNQGESKHVWPQILPGGKEVLFTSLRTGGLENQFEVYSLQTHKRYPIFKGGSYARYMPTGRLVYGRNETLYAVRFDLERRKVIGPDVPVIPGLMTPPSGSAQFATSRDGTLAYVPVQARGTELKPVWVDRQGQVEPLPAATPRNYRSARVSPDGTRLAFDIMDGDNRDIWIYDLKRDTLNPLTSDGGSSFPVWSPDGNSVLFAAYQPGKLQVFGQSAAGSGKPELLAECEEIVGVPMSCSPDGKELLIGWSDPNHPRWDNDIWVARLDKQGQKSDPRPFIQRNHNQRHGVWSPDGRWVAYAADESGRWEVYVEPYPGPGPKLMISTGGGYQPLWSRDGKELFYRRGNKMIAASFQTEPEFRVTQFEELFEGRYLCRVDHRDYDVAPDGRFLMIQEPQASTPLGINVVLNWFEELKRLVPLGED